MTGAKWEHDHIVHIGGETETPADPASETGAWRKRIEPWLSAIFQSEHLALLLGSGFTTSIAINAGGAAVGMNKAVFGCAHEDRVNAHADKMASAMGRGAANIEDQLSAALSLLSGLQILEHADAAAWEAAIDKVLTEFIKEVLATEKGIRDGLDKSPASGGPLARQILGSKPIKSGPSDCFRSASRLLPKRAVRRRLTQSRHSSPIKVLFRKALRNRSLW